ncbi:thioredoxin fold domain-containing protein [Sulfurospirillum sp. 1612]|uniref:thioredoxin fold domain-containing protein n=1 Tax=Sulfurospirillum sp. 1612 TaxID=3094835 RepID=UPI002F942DF5
MRNIFVLVFAVLLASHLNADYKTGKAIFAKKCASCHGGYISAKILKKNFYKDHNSMLHLTAPTVNMIAYAMKDSPTHIGDSSDPAMQKMEMESYLQDYLYHPNINNSICEPDFIKYYDKKESMKGEVSEKEIANIVDYIYDYRKMRLLAHPKPRKNFSGTLDLPTLIDEAKRQNKILLVEAMSQTCHFCKRMEKDVFSKQRVKEAIKKDFIFEQVDIEHIKLPPLLLKHYQKITPSFFMISPDGKLLNAYPGAWKTNDFLEILKENKALK